MIILVIGDTKWADNILTGEIYQMILTGLVMQIITPYHIVGNQTKMKNMSGHRRES
jgi:hypothetical protein